MKLTRLLFTGAAALAVGWSGFNAGMTPAMAKEPEKADSKRNKVEKETAAERAADREIVRISEVLPRTHFRASDLIGVNIQNKQGEEIGDVENIVLHLGKGRVEYVVMAKGEFLELGGERFAIPLAAFKQRVRDETPYLQLDVTAAQLAKAPDLKGEKWPMVVDYKWLGTVYTFGFRPDDNAARDQQSSDAKKSDRPRRDKKQKKQDDDAKEKSEKQSGKKSQPAADAPDKKVTRKENRAAHRAEDQPEHGIPAAVTIAVSAELTGHLAKFSDFEGMNVRSSDNEKVGEITDLVIDQKSGQIAYAVVSRGGVLGVGASSVAIPMNAFTADHSDDEVILRIAASERQFEATAALNEKSWPTTAPRAAWLPESRQKQRHDAKQRSDQKKSKQSKDRDSSDEETN